MGVISIVTGDYKPTYNWGGTTLYIACMSSLMARPREAPEVLRIPQDSRRSALLSCLELFATEFPSLGRHRLKCIEIQDSNFAEFRAKSFQPFQKVLPWSKLHPQGLPFSTTLLHGLKLVH